MDSKPSVFIGSSNEGLSFAAPVRDLLHATNEIEPTLWTELFDPGDIPIHTLIKESERFSFAVLVLTPDDKLDSRGEEQLSPRDNVVFELGLFMGQLGPKQTFMVRPEGRFKMPSDVAGVICVTHDAAEDKTAEARRVCERLHKSIRQKWAAKRGTTKQINELRSDIALAREAAKMTLTQYERDHLLNLRRGTTDGYVYCSFLEDEMKHLCQHGYIAEVETGILWRMKDKGASKFDLRAFFKMTASGEDYLKFIGDGR